MSEQLMEQLTQPENLLTAWRVVRGNVPRYRRAQSAGPDGVTLAEFERDLNAQLTALRDMLAHSRYQPAPPKVVKLPKPRGGTRLIGVLNVSDRVAQRAATQVLAPHWESDFLDCNFGFRPGRGTPTALGHIAVLRQQGCAWVVEADIEDCFGSLNHDLLLKRCAQRVRDPRVLALVERWLDAGALTAGLPGDEEALAEPSRWQAVASEAKRGLGWVLESVFPGATGPHTDITAMDTPRYPRQNSPSGEGADTVDFETLAQADYQRRMVWSVLAAGATWLRPNVGAFIYKTGQALAAPAARRVLRAGGWMALGLAGVAAAGAVSAAALHHYAGPAPMGVVQGSPLSPLMANVYLHPFDRWMSQRGHHLVRYADDFVVMAETEAKAESAYNDTLHGLHKMRLRVNRQKLRIVRPGERWEFLGAEF